ncbi:MAG: hypothetical protein V5A18_10290, partial [Haloarculaceae archaeon]
MSELVRVAGVVCNCDPAAATATPTATTQNALSSLSKGITTVAANSQKALTSLSRVESGATANSQKALTSLAVAEQDI